MKTQKHKGRLAAHAQLSPKHKQDRPVPQHTCPKKHPVSSPGNICSCGITLPSNTKDVHALMAGKKHRTALASKQQTQTNTNKENTCPRPTTRQPLTPSGHNSFSSNSPSGSNSSYDSNRPYVLKVEQVGDASFAFRATPLKKVQVVQVPPPAPPSPAPAPPEPAPPAPAPPPSPPFRLTKVINLVTEAEASAEASAPPPFPDTYRNLLKDKHEVNLYVSNNRVVWQFKYDVLIIEAIKTFMNGRSWDSSIGAKGRWTTPLESLPRAIALYKHLGRTPDKNLQQRAATLSSAADFESDITLRLQLLSNDVRVGRVTVTFLYDAAVVAAIKQLLPTHRAYVPSSKAWHVDLLALPELVEFLEPLGYKPFRALEDLAAACVRLRDDLYPENAAQASGVDFDGGDFLSDDVLAALDIDQIVAGRAAGIETKAKDLDKEADRGKGEGEEKGEELARMLAHIGQLVELGDGRTAIDRSDCGRLKPLKKATGKARLGKYDWIDDYEIPDDYYPGAGFVCQAQGLSQAIARQPVLPPPARRSFGYFKCEGGACGNSWTSAYCWDGEKQGCQKCERESYAWKKEDLKPGKGNGKGGHDSSRCGRCKSGKPCNFYR